MSVSDAPTRLSQLSPAKRALLEKRLQSRQAKLAQEQTIERRKEGENTLPLSFAQQRLWFIDQLQPGSGTYNMANALRLIGPLKITALERCLNEIIRRHEALRTTFGKNDAGEPVQVIAPELSISLQLDDLSMLPGAKRESYATSLTAFEAKRPFDLSRGPLIRARLLRLTAEEHVLLFTMHHIISDGWSMGVLVHEVGVVYSAYAQNQQSPLPELPIQYGDFALWQRQWLQGQTLEEQLTYWKQQLGGERPLLALPTDHPRPPVQGSSGANELFDFPIELTDELRKIGYREDATLFMTLLAAFQVLLYRYTGQTDFLIGSPTANRNRPETENLIGFFVNTLVLRADLHGNPTFRELLRRVQKMALEAFAHQDLPFEKLVEELQPDRDLSRNPLVQIVLALQNTPMGSLDLYGLTVAPHAFEWDASRMDLEFHLNETPAGLTGLLAYNTDLFEKQTIQRLLEHFATLLEGIVANPDQRISELPLLTSRERARLLFDFNDTKKDPATAQAIHELFEAQVKHRPEAAAVEFEGQTITYAELENRSNQLAYYLRARGVGPETIVALLLERSPDQIIAILAVLKAGGAYVPIEVSYPRERRAFVLQDSGAKLLLTHAELSVGLTVDGLEVVALDEERDTIAEESEARLESGVAADNAAYMIYTSGSTGQPKGVLVNHRSLINSILTMLDVCDEPFTGTIIQMSYAFDGSLLGIFCALSTGARVTLCSEGQQGDGEQIARLISASRTSHLWLVPSFYSMLLELAAPEQLEPLRAVYVGAEALPSQLVQRHYQVLPQTHLFNIYGPTEAAIWCTAHQCQRQDEEQLVPIGRSASNMQLYLLDKYLHPVPIGVAGRLYIGGVGLARGYWNRPELTAEAFIPNPFSSESGERLYWTGDIARYLENGELVWLAREDEQVKVRGYRIELGEVETALAEISWVRNAVVLARANDAGDRRLVAYVVAADADGHLSAPHGSLREQLKAKLPEYMIPSAFVFLEKLPLTTSGKVDRRALPEPDPGQDTSTQNFVPPGTPVEKELAKIWSDVLKIEKIGVNDVFFDLGGHSLLATQLISRVSESFNVDLAVRTVFEAPTIAELALRIETAKNAAKESSPPPLVPVARRTRRQMRLDQENKVEPPKETSQETSQPVSALVPVPRTGPLPLSFAQQRLWFMHILEPDSPAYNVGFVHRLRGVLDHAALEKTISEIVRRHETLRTTFSVTDGQLQQVIAPPHDLELPVTDLRHLPEPERRSEAQSIAAAETNGAFDLQHGPLLRARLLRLGSEDHMLVFTMHHIISDGWGLGILVRELETLYAAFVAGKPSPLPPLPIQYVDFAHWQRRYLTGDVLENHLRHWQERLGGTLPVLELPADRPRLAIQSFRGAGEQIVISPEFNAQLNALARREGVTLFMLLLAAFNVLLYRYTGEEDIIVGSPIANRNRVEIEGLIGCFVNMLVLRTDLSGAPSFRELLDRVRTIAFEAYAHQDMPFEKLVEHLHPERSMSRHPLFQVLFQLGNAPTHEAVVSGLVFEGVYVEKNTTQFDLSLDLVETPDGLSVVAEYSTDLFDATTIARLLRHFQILLESIVNNPDESIARLSMLTGAEHYQLIRRWNQRSLRYDADKCLPELFEAQVRQTPKAIAVDARGEQLSYEALNSRANQLAHYLRALGVGPEVRVAVLMEPSIEMVTSLLAILKAGGAYVPLDPLYPKQRLSYMIANAQASLLLTREDLNEAIPDLRIVSLETAAQEIAQHDTSDPLPVTTPGNLAYVIYTSGSTGQPKGVGVTHKSLINHQAVARDVYGLSANDRVLQFASLSFDVAAEEIFPTLLSGATLVLRNQQVKAALVSGLLQEVRERNITVLNLPASAWQELVVQVAANVGLPDCLRLLVVGSEPVTRESFAAWRKKAGDRPRVLNAYGTTETTITATIYEPGGDEVHSGSALPIGRPLPNTHAYILDRFLQPVPVGVSGELYIGGAGVARGYLNHPGLTAERFVPNAFGNEPGARLYRTGDVARYLPDGNIEFIGRADRQVKVRGYRVELGEIEAVLSEHPSVRRAVVDVTGNDRLVAYVVTEPDRAIAKNELREFLRERLPEFMIPGSFVTTTNDLPLMPSGKVDRSALPAPEEARGETELPRSKTEELIAAAWREVLQVEKVGIHENFFDLGGHSLLMVRVHDRLREAFGEKLTMLDLFKYPTINDLAAFLTNEQSPTPRIEVKAQTQTEGSEIAIIGMAGRFPAARTLNQFWQNLCGGVEAISFYSDEELLAAGVAPEVLNNPNYVKAGVLLEDIDQFDASFFGYNPREAEVMDPQHRLFLECAWEALENAGHDPEQDGGSVGVFAGTGSGTYVYNLLSNPDIVDAAGGMQLAIGNDKDHLPTHVSYKLNLRGPSVAVQTACSASLVAVHMACRSVLNGECRMALAGGVAIHDLEKRGYLYQAGGIGSPDGHCRAFDAGAQGTISGSGVGIVVLKRLQDALSDGDFIHAVIKGSAINNDGSAKVGYTAPSIEGQAGVIRAAQLAAGVPAEDITYIEAHGTGTSLGDPIEIAALTQAFRETTNQKGFCAVGSVKTNIGHLDTAAGVAGLIKTVLALEHKVVPPSLHFEQPNPALDLDNSPFYINKHLSLWKSDNGARRAGVSSFGIGGTNAHVIVEEAPAVESSAGLRPWHLLMLSAKTESALEQATARLAEYFHQHPDANLPDVAYTLQVGRKTFSHRRVVMCRTNDEALKVLTSPDPAHVFNSSSAAQDQKVVFMFPGQGAQHVNMGRDLYQREAVFREHVDHCCELLKPQLDLDLRDVLYPREENTDDAAARLKQTHVTQPALFVIEYALARLWMSWGINPSAMIGHSIGEYVAACLAGVFSLEDALSLVALRAKLMHALPEGAMLSVALGEDELRGMMGPTLSLAAVNGPSLSVVSGPHEAVAGLEASLTEKNVQYRRLVTSHAFHSQMMEPIIGEFTAKLSKVKFNAPKVPYVSNVTGSWIKTADPDYWASHLRETVRFADGARTLLSDSNSIMLEVGPGRSLSSIVAPLARESGQTVVNSLPAVSEEKSASESLTAALAKLWLAGATVDWQQYYSQEKRRRLPLPTYPFERRRYWIEWQPIAGNGHADFGLRKKPDVADWFYLPHWKPSVLPAVSVPLDHAPVWLCFLDEGGFSQKLAERLEQSGCEVVTVRAGESFARLDDGSYAINVAQAEDYEALLVDLKGRLPEHVLHSFSVKSENALRDGFYSVIFLARALEQHGSRDGVTITILSDGVRSVTGEEEIVPEKATLLGPCTVIPQEYPHITCRNIDVVTPPTNGWREQNLIAQITSDLLSESKDMAVAYRANQRWVQAFEPVRLQRAAGARLREEGVYLITGGLSGIGVELAEHLARTKRAKLVLVGRVPLPPRNKWQSWISGNDEVSSRIRRVLEIEELGGAVLAASADVSDAGQMREVLRQARARFGKMDGVIHAAGVAPGRLIAAGQDAQAADTLAPKVKGTRVLEDLFKDEGLDFLVLFSSLSSVLGAFGQVDYCAANAFLDAFAYYNIQQNSIPTVTINWDTWRDTGMALRATRQFRAGEEDLLENAISTAEGLDAFERVLAHELMPQVLVSTRDLHHVIEHNEKRTQSQIFDEAVRTQQAGPAHPRPDLQTAHVAPRNELEEQIAGMWENLLGIERVGVHDNFFELGGHSLLATQLGSRFREALGVDLPLRIIFERPNVAALAQYVEQAWLEVVEAPAPIAKIDRQLHRRGATRE
jgi:amino acid adenylation domain-containing protein